jgi:ribosomal protein S18 acetylase RimI-like enzyme
VTTRSSADATTVRALAPGSRFDRDAELLGLILDAFEGQRGRVVPPSSAFSETEENLARRRQAEWLVLAEDAVSNVLAGCLFAEARPGELYLSKIAVGPGHRNLGLAGRMIDQAVPIARSADCPWLTLNVRVSLQDNLAIFRRLGFEICGGGSHPGFDVPTYHRMRRSAG